MRYYYADAQNQPIGPVDEHELLQLRQTGIVTDQTLIIPENGTTWQSYATVFASVAVPPPLPEPARPSFDLASPWARLGARLINLVAMTVFSLPLLVAIPFVTLGKETAVVILSFLIALVSLAYIITSIYLLATRGQDIGKWLIGIRIVKRETGTNGGFVTNVVLRGFVNGIIASAVPFYGLVDALFIFSEQNRCIHDRIADTVVVNGNPPAE